MGIDKSGEKKTNVPPTSARQVGRGVYESQTLSTKVLVFFVDLEPSLPPAPPVNTPQYQANEEHLLTVCCHANIDAFLKATFLALVASDFVYDAFSFIFAGIRWMKTFLNGSSKETLNKKDPKRTRFIFFETMTTLEFYVYLK